MAVLLCRIEPCQKVHPLLKAQGMPDRATQINVLNKRLFILLFYLLISFNEGIFIHEKEAIPFTASSF
ncbi:MAG: hypothetical protein M1418_08765 [Deltaproteobacteria bacterium]|nr:hypothetical protein [Deltaproteobacteria bacterium]